MTQSLSPLPDQSESAATDVGTERRQIDAPSRDCAENIPDVMTLNLRDEDVEASIPDIDQSYGQTDPKTISFEVAKSLQRRARTFYSTTSSVYAEQTILNPNAEQLLFW